MNQKNHHVSFFEYCQPALCNSGPKEMRKANSKFVPISLDDPNIILFILDKLNQSTQLNYPNGLKNQLKTKKLFFMIIKNSVTFLKLVLVDFLLFILHVGKILNQNLQLKNFLKLL